MRVILPRELNRFFQRLDFHNKQSNVQSPVHYSHRNREWSTIKLHLFIMRPICPVDKDTFLRIKPVVIILIEIFFLFHAIKPTLKLCPRLLEYGSQCTLTDILLFNIVVYNRTVLTDLSNVNWMYCWLWYWLDCHFNYHTEFVMILVLL